MTPTRGCETAGIPLLDRESLDDKARLEDRHWWYRGRRRVVAAALARLPRDGSHAMLDAGFGTGRNLDWLSDFGPVHGIDVNPQAVARAAAQGHRRILTGTLDDLPYEDGRFGLITCLDVLEHVSDDVTALVELRRVTRREGFLLLTVPAFQMLFSSHDVAAGHVRRYSLRALAALAVATGWRVVQQTYFNAFLFPIAFARRAWSGRVGTRRPPRSDLLVTPASLDLVLEAPMMVEARLVRYGVRLPVGLSILIILQKP
jgi:SAM-dependent methyltransferase